MPSPSTNADRLSPTAAPSVHAGHFNVYEIEPFTEQPKHPLPYDKRDFYKVTVLEGASRMLHADREVEIGRQALIFSNPFEPYCRKHFGGVHHGHYAIFTDAFFPGYGSLSRFPVFQPDHDHAFDLDDAQLAHVQGIFQRMHTEIRSDYAYTYDLLRSLSEELMHFGMKLRPLVHHKQPPNARLRLARMFVELLSRTTWRVAQIADVPGFPEPAHFSNFFRKHADQSPVRFRAV
ncbi:MAG: AraC family transcriptional regulator [Bacteroidetes bacterium]|nr:AraC family transcriptional regulator [Bacteroidota bacterium]